VFQKCKLRLAKALGTICATTTVKEVKIKIKVSVHETEVGRQLLDNLWNTIELCSLTDFFLLKSLYKALVKTLHKMNGSPYLK